MATRNSTERGEDDHVLLHFTLNISRRLSDAERKQLAELERDPGRAS